MCKKFSLQHGIWNYTWFMAICLTTFKWDFNITVSYWKCTPLPTTFSSSSNRFIPIYSLFPWQRHLDCTEFIINHSALITPAIKDFQMIWQKNLHPFMIAWYQEIVSNNISVHFPLKSAWLSMVINYYFFFVIISYGCCNKNAVLVSFLRKL